MAEFKIRMPDGQIKTVSGPNRAGAMAFAKKNYNSITPPPPAAQDPDVVGNPNASRLQFAQDQAASLFGKGLEAAGRATGLEGIEGFGTFINERNQKQIKDRNYQSTNQGSFLDQEGLGAKAAWTGEKIVENSITGAVGLGGAAATAVAGFFSAPLWVTAGIAATAVGSSTMLGAGEVAGELEEKTGSYNPTLALGGGVLIGLLDRLGATSVIPKDQILKMTGREVIDNLVSKGYGRMASELAQSIAKKSAVEGGTEMLQEGVSVATSASQGGEYTGPELLNRGVDSFVLGAGQGGVVASVTDTASLGASLAKLASNGSFSDIRDLTEQQAQASGDVARQLQKIANDEGFSLNDVNPSSQFGAKGALESLRDDNNGEITSLAKLLRSQMDVENADSLNELLNVFAPASSALKAGKNKVSGYVTIAQMKALGKIVGASPEGQQLMNALAKSNIITGLFKDGMKGGVSQFTDYFSPLGTSGAVYDPSRLANIMIGAGLGGTVATATGGASLPIQGGLVGLGRLIDKATGRRSTLNSFIKKNKNGSTLPTPSGVSMLDKAKQAAEDTTARSEALARISETLGAPPKDNSPVGSILSGTGLDRPGLSQLIKQMASDFSVEPELLPVLESIEKNISGGNNPVLGLNEIIPILGQYAQQARPDLIVATPDNILLARTAPAMPTTPGVAQDPSVQTASASAPQAQTQAPAQPMVQTNGNLTTSQANYEAGKQANLDAVVQMQTSVLQAPNLPQAEQEALFDALEVAMQPATEPLVAMQEIEQTLLSQGVAQENVDTYFKPYVDRVLRQQGRKPSLLAQAQAAQEPVIKTSPLQQAQVAQGPSPEERRQAAFDKLQLLNKARMAEEAEGKRQPLKDILKAATAQFSGKENADVRKSPLEQAQASQQPETKAPLTGNAAINAVLDNDLLVPDATSVGKAIGGTMSDGQAVIDQLTQQGFIEDGMFFTDAMYAATPMPAYESLLADINSRNPASVDQRYVTEAVGVNDTTALHLLKKLRASNIIGEKTAGTERSPVLPRQPEESRSAPEMPSGPALNQVNNPLQVSNSDLDATNMSIMPSPKELSSMKSGTYKPIQKRTLVEFAQVLQDRWQKATGRTTAFEQTPENIDQISRLMATEAANALKSDNNAIGWYDRKLKAAKAVVSLVDPRVTQSPEAEAAFDYALAVTSNGQAVADNFEYAMMVFREFMDTGRMPTDTWIKGGERNKSMVDAFSFFNAYQDSGQNIPMHEFLDSDFTVSDLSKYIGQFNSKYDTSIKVPSSEAASEMVKGSYIIGPKIGQGFYQNIRGNYDPLTMDIWWMRMWNRLTGRAFEDLKDLSKNRSTIRSELKSADVFGKRLIKETMSAMGIKKSDLKDDTILDDFVSKLDKRYQAFFRKSKKQDPQAKPPKPQLFRSTGTMVKNLVLQLQAQPKNAGERSYMRQVTASSLSKLKDIGIDISTADFQALMWYPEKQLFRKGGVAPGRGADNDYLDAAKMLATKEGISNEQIEEALPASERRGAVNNLPSPEGQDGGLYPGPDGPQVAADAQLQRPALTIPGGTPTPAIGPAGPRPISPQRRPFSKVTIPSVRQFFSKAKVPFEIGKPGSRDEDGIQTIDRALELSTALGMTVNLFNNQSKMTAAAGISPRSKGSYDLKSPRKGGKGSEGTIFGLNPGAHLSDGSTVSGIESLSTLLHEIGHGMTLGPMDLNSSQSNFVTFTNPVTGQQDYAPPGSFADSAIKPLLEGKGDPAILAEIDNLQQNIDTYTTNDPKQRVALRDVRSFMRTIAPWVAELDKKYDQAVQMGDTDYKSAIEAEYSAINEDGNAYMDYIKNVRELSVDPMVVYYMNPKLMKALAPKTAALIKSEFKKAGNKTIQFYSHPLPIVIATVMAMLAKGAEEKEEEEGYHQMPDGSMMKNSEMDGGGALSPQQAPPGLLTQQVA